MLTPLINHDDHIKGAGNAHFTLVEFGDYQSSESAEANNVVKKLEKHFGEYLGYAYRHFPLAGHPLAFRAALAAEAAGRQKMFWQMHDILFEQQELVSETDIQELAMKIGLNMFAFSKVISDRSVTEKVESDIESGKESGVNTAPTFFINGYKYSGKYDYDSLKAGLEHNNP
jgi:protein-disulfide isomerase